MRGCGVAFTGADGGRPIQTRVAVPRAHVFLRREVPAGITCPSTFFRYNKFKFVISNDVSEVMHPESDYPTPTCPPGQGGRL